VENIEEVRGPNHELLRERTSTQRSVGHTGVAKKRRASEKSTELEKRREGTKPKLKEEGEQHETQA